MSNRRIVLIHNPLSSRAKGVSKKVIQPIQKANLPSGQFIEYTITPIGPNNNARVLSRKLREGDLVISAGGDGTASIVANAILSTSFKKIHMASLRFGNFNDIASTFPASKINIQKLLSGDYKTVKLFPLEVKTNNRRFRYAVLYAGLGLLAGAANQFENKKHRYILRHGGANLVYSLVSLLPYYLRNKRHYFMPTYALGEETVADTTDYLAVNGPVVAKMFRTGRDLHKKPTFLRATLDVSHFWRSVPFVLRSIKGSMPGTLTKRDDLIFAAPVHVAIQTDGEYEELFNVDKITIKKSEKHINIAT